jgi:NAD-dependent DNA ligase
VPKLEGKTLVVTGTLVRFKRAEIKELILQHGGKASGSVSLEGRGDGDLAAFDSDYDG